jgi:hypothetical protein
MGAACYDRSLSLYHIYIKDNCLYPNLEEREFHQVWEALNKMTKIYSEELSYEEVVYNKKDYSIQGDI